MNFKSLLSLPSQLTVRRHTTTSPGRSLRVPVLPTTSTVVIDADYLAASTGRSALALPHREFLSGRTVRLPFSSGPSATALLTTLSPSLLTKAAHSWNGLSYMPDETLDRVLRSDSASQVTSPRAEDPSLSSETPLPPSSPELWGSAEEPAYTDSSEFMDEEIEIIDSSEEQRSNALAAHDREEHSDMALTSNNIKENLSKLESIEGFIGAALSDSDSGMCIGFIGGAGIINLEVAAAANTEVVRSKRKAMKSLNLRDDIEDMLITLGKQYHLIRPVRSRPSLFYYLVLDRQRSNLAMARFTLADTERELPL